MVTRAVARSMVLGALVCATVLGVPSSGFGATPDTPYEAVRVEAPQPQHQARWGERSALASDVDGDGVRDVWLSAFQQDVDGVSRAGRVYLISGRTQSVIYSVASPEPQSNSGFGFTVASPGDVTGDGNADLAVGAFVHDDFRGESSPGVSDSDPCGAPEPNGCYENTGQAWVYDGMTGRLVYELANPEPQENPELPFSKVFGFGTAISNAGDLTGDGRSEVIVGAASNDVPRGCGGKTPPGAVPAAPCRRDQGQAFVFNGADGSLLRTYNMPQEDLRPTPQCNADVGGPGIGTCGFLGQTVQGLGDTDGDGVTDTLVQGGTYGDDKAGRIWVFSGRTGEVLLKIDNPAPGEVRIFGLQTVEPGAPGDVNDDGFADIYGNGFQHRLESGSGPGRAWIFSGRDGSILYNLFDPSPELAGGFAFSGADTDFDLDGEEDEFIAGQNGSGLGSGGGASIFGVPTTFGPSATAPALKDFQAPEADRQPVGPPPANGLRFGRTVEAPGDVNGDCQPDYVIGAPHTDVRGNEDQGRVYFFVSRGPSVCPPPPPPPPVPPVPPAPIGQCGNPDAAGFLHPAKMRVLRARVSRKDRRLDVLAPITSRAGGDVAVTFHADNRKDTFDEDVTDANSALDVIRVSKRITRGQARLGTGIVNITYLGDEDTRPEFVRLRAASQRAELDVEEISLIGDRLSAKGSVTDRANGVVRFRFSYVDPDGTPNVHEARAKIKNNGDWKLNKDQVPAQLARCGGYLSIQFTGYFPQRIRGEQLAYQLNAGQTRRP